MNTIIRTRLLKWVSLFLILQSIILSLSPAVRERTWDVDYRLSHWVGLFVWGISIYLANWVVSQRLQDSDPYIFSSVALLSGWGLLSIWRLDEAFGARQIIWLVISLAITIQIIWYIKDLSLFKNFKYLFLGAGLAITALTLVVGSNPLGIGPRLWLGVGGVYFQPSEPLKILLVIYLSAYLADRSNLRIFSALLLVPTLLVTGISLLLLVVQRDLGTASIFAILYTVFLFIVSGKRRILISTGAFLLIVLLVGYFFIGIIQVRVIGWLNPWDDPTGNSYQIIQSLLAIANGGLAGRGLGIGNPLLVPVAISDFIFAAVAEESGLIGSLGLISILWLILARGLIAAQRAPDNFRRYLAAGISSYFGIQSLLIIGGNLRLLPLTGVTLPFVSYGGSSLLTSFVAVFLLLSISNADGNEAVRLTDPRPYSILAGLFAFGFAACAVTCAWWALFRADDLLTRTDNPRRAISDRYVLRGDLVDTNNNIITTTVGESGNYTRIYQYPDLAPISGYTHSVFGQAGLESSLDEYLRGLQGNPAGVIISNQLLYGTPPPGLDVRLSIDLTLQAYADQLLGNHTGAVILLNAETGEILVMASHPAFDPNNFDQEGNSLSQDETSPLLNRATQGLYPIGKILDPLLQVQVINSQDAPFIYFKNLGIFTTPLIRIPVADAYQTDEVEDLRASPLQIVTAAAALSNEGIIPAPRIATAVNTPEQGWVVLPALGQAQRALSAPAAEEAVLSLLHDGAAYWSHSSVGVINKTVVTWWVGGTPLDWQGAPLTVVVALEENNRALATQIGETFLGEIIIR